MQKVHEITVNKDVKEVWALFINPEFWGKWYIKGMLGPSPNWKKGNTVFWQDGGVSGILDFVENNTIQFENTNNEEKWFFTKEGSNATLIRFENHAQGFLPNYDMLAQALLAKLKTAIEIE